LTRPVQFIEYYIIDSKSNSFQGGKMLTITYLSHSCFTISDGTHNLIIDPFLNGNPMAQVKPEEVKADFVLITHGHGDHWGDTEIIAKQNDALVIGPNEICVYASGKGLKVHNMHIGGAFNFPFGRVKLTIAHHGFSSGESDLDIGGNPCGFVLTIDGKNVYHAGDTGLFMDMQLIGEEGIDLALLPIGDNFTMGIDDAVKAVEFIKPKKVIPMHYNTFDLIAVDPEDFKSKVAAKGFEAEILKVGNQTQL
jgi:L-ascorbate metabolism protein UlaG (beta-lactamase superfamily)